MGPIDGSTAQAAIAATDWLGAFDRHKGLTQILSSTVTIIVALSGWAWALSSNWRDRARFGKLVKEVAADLIAAAAPIEGFSSTSDLAEIAREAKSLRENPILPTLDYLVDNVPLEKWPSPSLYVAIRYLRDRAKVFVYRTIEDSPNSVRWVQDKLPGLVSDYQIAADNYRKLA